MIREAKSNGAYANIAFQTGADASNEQSREYNLNSVKTINPLLQGLSRRGITQIFHYNTSAVYQNGDVNANGYWMDFSSRRQGSTFNFSYTPGKEPLSQFDFIFMRGDDVDETSVDNLKLVDRLEKPVLVNSGSATLATRDKFEIPKRFEEHPELIPETYTVTSTADLKKAWESLPGDLVVLKGRYGSCGNEVERFPKTSQGYQSAEEYFRKVGDLVAQEFLPEIVNGDIRVNVFDGDIIGAFKRLPNGSWITNVTNGGRVGPIELGNEFRKRIKLATSLFPEVRFQGVDLTLDSGKFIETNAFPASLGTVNRVYDTWQEEEILARLSV